MKDVSDSPGKIGWHLRQIAFKQLIFLHLIFLIVQRRPKAPTNSNLKMKHWDIAKYG